MKRHLQYVRGHFHGPSMYHLFLDGAPRWFKNGLLFCLAINPAVLYYFGSFTAGWVLLVQFIATLALALFRFPLFTGGFILLEAWALGLVSMENVHVEIVRNFPVLMLVLFVVTAVTFLKDLLTYLFLRTVLALKNELLLGLFFLLIPALLSALLDALTVTAVVAAVLLSLYEVYHRHASEVGKEHPHNSADDARIKDHQHGELQAFRAALRRLIMLALIGTMLGGITTIIGEPQNLLIAGMLGWDFVAFFVVMLPVSGAVILAGIIVCIAVERVTIRGNGWFDFAKPLPAEVRWLFEAEISSMTNQYTHRDRSRLGIQAVGALMLVLCLVFHLAEVYLVGLILLIFVGGMLGSNEHHVADALKEGGPFVLVLAVFFGIVAMIHEQHLFAPVSKWVLSFEGSARLVAYYGATGLLSAISDNVFVASLFMSDVETLHRAGTIDRVEYELIARAINMGTNIPSIATPNGQAAFLFFLMHPLAKLIRLDYLRMVWLALPFAVACTAAGAAAIWYF